MDLLILQYSQCPRLQCPNQGLISSLIIDQSSLTQFSFLKSPRKYETIIFTFHRKTAENAKTPPKYLKNFALKIFQTSASTFYLVTVGGVQVLISCWSNRMIPNVGTGAVGRKAIDRMQSTNSCEVELSPSRVSTGKLIATKYLFQLGISNIDQE